MNGWMDFLIGYFSVFFEVMFLIPSQFKIWYWHEAALLGLILAVALGVIFLCDWLVKKYTPGFTASVLLTFLVLSLTLGLTGFFLSIPRLALNPLAPFLIVGLGSPVFNIVLGVIATLGNLLSRKHPKAGTLLLSVVGLLFAYVLLTTFAVFFLSLYNY
jgi:hypothetical protein